MTAWLDILGGTMRYVEAGGVRTRVLEAGAGPPLVLLHGLGGHAETWLKNIVPLGERYHVYAIDMIGHGLTDKPEREYTVAVFARHVLDVLDAVGADRAHLVGQSLGGWAAGWLALEHPTRVLSLSLVTSAGLQVADVTPEQIGQTHGQVRTVTRAALEAPTREGVRKRLEWLMHDPARVTDELVETRFRIYTRADTQAVMPRIVDDITGEGRWPYMLTPDRLRQIQTPSLVLWTRHNPTTPWQEGQAAAELLPHAQFVLLEDCAHWPQFEAPAQFNQLLGGFLQLQRQLES